jgi:hypothetical protein
LAVLSDVAKKGYTEFQVVESVLLLTVYVKFKFLKLPCQRSKKVKVIPQQAEVAQGVPGRLRPWIFLTFGTTRMVGHQPDAPATFTPGELPGTHFRRLSRPQGTGGATEKIPSDTTGNRSRDRPTSTPLVVTTTLPQAPCKRGRRR